jgi:hypothetical protein
VQLQLVLAPGTPHATTYTSTALVAPAAGSGAYQLLLGADFFRQLGARTYPGSDTSGTLVWAPSAAGDLAYVPCKAVRQGITSSGTSRFGGAVESAGESSGWEPEPSVSLGHCFMARTSTTGRMGHGAKPGRQSPPASEEQGDDEEAVDYRQDSSEEEDATSDTTGGSRQHAGQDAQASISGGGPGGDGPGGDGPGGDGPGGGHGDSGGDGHGRLPGGQEDQEDTQPVGPDIMALLAPALLPPPAAPPAQPATSATPISPELQSSFEDIAQAYHAALKDSSAQGLAGWARNLQDQALELRLQVAAHLQHHGITLQLQQLRQPRPAGTAEFEAAAAAYAATLQDPGDADSLWLELQLLEELAKLQRRAAMGLGTAIFQQGVPSALQHGHRLAAAAGRSPPSTRSSG